MKSLPICSFMKKRIKKFTTFAYSLKNNNEITTFENSWKKIMKLYDGPEVSNFILKFLVSFQKFWFPSKIYILVSFQKFWFPSKIFVFLPKFIFWFSSKIFGNDNYLYRNSFCARCNSIENFELVNLTANCVSSTIEPSQFDHVWEDGTGTATTRAGWTTTKIYRSAPLILRRWMDLTMLLASTACLNTIITEISDVKNQMTIINSIIRIIHLQVHSEKSMKTTTAISVIQQMLNKPRILPVWTVMKNTFRGMSSYHGLSH